MMPRTGSPIQAVSQIWAAGRIEMKLSEMPARVPSSAARGVILRMTGPMNAPISTITPITNAQARPACQARIGSPVLSAIGSMITKTTMNMCGTLGPYGIAVTSSRCSRRASRRARIV